MSNIREEFSKNRGWNGFERGAKTIAYSDGQPQTRR